MLVREAVLDSVRSQPGTSRGTKQAAGNSRSWNFVAIVLYAGLWLMEQS
ncbi:MAG: hypothetical protein ABF753_07755 [Lentilactobacillus hilgardii]